MTRIKEPVLIAELVDVQDCEFMQQRIESLEGITRGERAIVEGQVYTNKQAKGLLSKWLK